MNALQGLETAYDSLMGLCDASPAGLAGREGQPMGNEDFAEWHAKISESAKRFVGATGDFCKKEAGHTGLNNFIADREMAQMCDYMVKHWDTNIEGAARQVQVREHQLQALGRMRSFYDVGNTLGFKHLKPLRAWGMSGAFELEPTRSGMLFMHGALRQDMCDAIAEDARSPRPPLEGYDPMPSLTNREWCTVGMLCGILDEIDGQYYVTPLDPYTEGLEGLGNWFRDKFRQARRWVGNKVSSAARAVKRTVSNAGRAVRRVVRKAGDVAKRVGRTVKNTWNTVVDKAKSVFTGVASVFAKTVSFVRNGVTYVWDKAKGLCKKIGNALVAVAKNVADALVALARKIKNVVRRFAKFINPKNIISRVVLLRNITKGKHGIADGAYWGLAGQAEAARNGVSAADYQQSKRAYDRLQTNIRNWGGTIDSLNAAIRAGRGKFRGPARVPSRAEVQGELQQEAEQMDRKAIVAQEQAAIYQREGVDVNQNRELIAQAQAEAGVQGLGIVVTAVIGIITAIVGLIIAIIQLVMSIIRNKREKRNLEEQRKREEERLRRQQADQKKRQNELAAKQARDEAKARALEASIARSAAAQATHRSAAAQATHRPSATGGKTLILNRDGSSVLVPTYGNDGRASLDPAGALQESVKKSGLLVWLPIAIAGTVGLVGAIAMMRRRAAAQAEEATA